MKVGQVVGVDVRIGVYLKGVDVFSRILTKIKSNYVCTDDERQGYLLEKGHSKG